MLRVEGTEDEITRQCDDGSLPLHIAVGNANIKNTLILLREGTSPNATNHAGNTPLHICARIKNVQIARVILSAGGKLGLQNNSKETPFSTAKLYHNDELTKYFEAISSKKRRRDQFQSILKENLPELCDEEVQEPVSMTEEHAPANTQEVQALAFVKKETKLLRRQIKRYEKRGLFDELPATDLSDDGRLEVPDAVNPIFRSYCAEIDTMHAKVRLLMNAYNIEPPQQPEAPQEDTKPLQEDYVHPPIRLFPASVMCDSCGSVADIPCMECSRRLCRLCYYSCLHTCPNKHEVKS